MIKFEDSQEAIEGLAKIIIQDPTFPARIRSIKKHLIDSKIINENKDYLEQQENILKKAEKIGFQNTGYVFQIMLDEYEENNYMLYKYLDKKMICLKKEFEINFNSTIKGLEELIQYTKQTNLKKLITFHPADQDSFHSFPWFEDGETDEDFSYGCGAFHTIADFNKEELKILNKNNIKTFQLGEKEAYNFNMSLERIN